MKKPPQVSKSPFIEIAKVQPDLLSTYMGLHNPVDKKGRYLPFNEIYRRLPSALDPQLAWSVIRDARQAQLTTLAQELESRLEFVADWFNTIEPSSSSSAFVIATSLHFAIGFEHPFHDGNGRLARALFYWSMFKYGYHAFRYISISALLNEAPVKYGKSYIHTETDNMDMTYFIDYQSKVASKAIDQFLQDFSVLVDRYQNFKQQFESSTLYKQTNEKQRADIILVHNIGIKTVNAAWVQTMVACSYNTAASVLNGLTELGVFQREKVGREWHYSMLKKIVDEDC